MEPPIPSPSSAHALWHTPELLTCILTHVKPLDSTTSRTGTHDLARIMLASKYTFEHAVPVLYESEGVFPSGVERFDLKRYLKERGSTEARIQFYISKIKRLDYYSRPLAPPFTHILSTGFIDLRFWLKGMFKAYPSATMIHFLVDDMVVSAARSNSGEYASFTILTTGRAEVSTPVTTMYRRLCEQMASVEDAVLPLTGMTLGPTMFSAAGAGSQGVWAGLGLGEPGGAYANMKQLDIRAVRITSAGMRRVLQISPQLESLRVDVEAGGALPADIDPDFVCPSLKILDLKIPALMFNDLPHLFATIPQLDDLQLNLGPGPFKIVHRWSNHPILATTKLVFSGEGMSHEGLQNVLGMFPSAVKLTAYWQATPTVDDLKGLWDLVGGLRSIQELHLFPHGIIGYELESAIDNLTQNLPSLISLSLPVQLYIMPSNLELPSTTEEPMWPRLKHLTLWISLQNFNYVRPTAISIASALCTGLQPKALLGLQCQTHGRDVMIGQKNMSHLEQWLWEVYSAVGFLMRGMQWQEEGGEGEPGWKCEGSAGLGAGMDAMEEDEEVKEDREVKEDGELEEDGKDLVGSVVDPGASSDTGATDGSL